MKVLALEKEIQKEVADKSLLADEARRVYTLYKQGKIREIYFDRQRHTAVIVFEVEDIGEAGELIQSLPLVQAQVIRFDLIELLPYDGLDRIIER